MKERVRVLIGAIMLVILIAFTFVINYLLTRKDENNLIVSLDPELQRAMTYEKFEDGDENIEGTDNVKFSAFFLRDLDGDGYAEKIKGTCREIGAEDTLYMEIIVQSEGYLKNGKIEIDGKNFYLQTALPKDSEIKNHYISNNTKEIEFNTMNNGIQKLLITSVRSGVYPYDTRKNEAIGDNINNYSRDNNKVIFTGIYVTGTGEEIEINKELSLSVDWYGKTHAEIEAIEQDYNDLQSRINEEENYFKVAALIKTEETNKMLNTYSYHAEGEIPELNGYAPIGVYADSNDLIYDESTRKFTIDRFAETDENGTIINKLDSRASDRIEIRYPLEAYLAGDPNFVTISIPVSAYYEGYNNPNSEFDNPYKSNTVKNTLLIKISPRVETATQPKIIVGEEISEPNWHYSISKYKPIKIYNGISEEEIDDIYEVTWGVFTGFQEIEGPLTFKETPNGQQQKGDLFIKADLTEKSMELYTTNIGLYFSSTDALSKEDGEIKVYDDETGILIHTFTSKDWYKYTENNPYKYDVPVKHIRIVTSNVSPGKRFEVVNIKKLDDSSIVENITREEFDSFEYIKSFLDVTIGNSFNRAINNKARYEEPISEATITLSEDTISTQGTKENMEIYLKARKETYNNLLGWKNGSFLIKFPDELIDIKINSVEIDNRKVTIDSYEVIRNQNGKFIRIETSNDELEKYQITINVDLTPDPRMATTTKKVTLFGKNEEEKNYKYFGTDIYDIDGDGNTSETIFKGDTELTMVSPNNLITNQIISEFDNDGSVVIGPEIAKLKPIYSEDDIEKQTVKIGAQFKNNYSGTISEIVMLGKIPFEGNTYVLGGGNLKSDFTTTITSDGITVPAALQNIVTIYYSENENPNKNLNDATNGWTLKEDVSDWSKIKTWLIDFRNFVLNPGDEYTFSYVVEIPIDADYNDVSYSHHGIYFSLDTPEGKYKSQTEPSKTGVMIADNYNLLLTKYQKYKETLVKGAMYRVSKLDDLGNIEESQTAITNEDGVLEMANLYAEKMYEIREIKSPNDYQLNDDVIKIIGHINRTNGVLTVEKITGTLKDQITVTNNEGENYKASLKVEDEVKVSFRLSKVRKNRRNRSCLKRSQIQSYWS